MSQGQDRALEMVRAYFAMEDSWFKTKRHDIPTLMNSLNSITAFLETGQTGVPKDPEKLADAEGLCKFVKSVIGGKTLQHGMEQKLRTFAERQPKEKILEQMELIATAAAQWDAEGKLPNYREASVKGILGL